MEVLKNIHLDEDGKYINLDLVDNSNRTLFRAIAEELANTFPIQWKAQVDGFDQSYWDFEIYGIVLTLHREHYLGICIYADKTKTDYKEAYTALKAIEKHFRTLS